MNLVNSNYIFLGTYGHCVCIDQNSGRELWRTSLTGVGYNPVTIYFEENRVYCGSNGKIFILCSATGKIIAENELVGQGYGHVAFTTKKSDSKSAPQINQQPQQQPVLIQQQPQLIQMPNLHPLFNQPLQLNQQVFQPQPFLQQQHFVQPQQQQSTLYPQPPLNNNNNNIMPQFPLDNDRMYEEDSLKRSQQLDKDEEFARYLDMELNGDNVPRNINSRNNIHQPLLNVIQYNHLSLDDLIFVGLNTYVTALNKYTAQEIWRANIGTFGMPVSVVYSNGNILVGTSGNLVCLDALNGRQLWKNNLPGLRYNNVSIISTTNNNLFSQSNSFFHHPQTY